MATKKKTATTKKKKATRKKKSTKKKPSVLRLMVINDENGCGLETVELDIKYGFAFRDRFGLLKAPTLEEFEAWKKDYL